MSAYYNEIDPYAAQWLRNLIAAGHIAPGDVDTRSIEDVKPDEIRGYTQCHFFAGIGVWSHALRRAAWPDDRPVWTGSCPCQPFSAAGKGNGFADERHLWPAWEWLIRQAKPRGVPVFGEQVASKAGLAWLDIVLDDLEGQGYTVRALDLCAAGAGAPHIRQRLYFAADQLVDTQHARLEGHSRHGNDRNQPGRLGTDQVGSASSAGTVGGRLGDAGHVQRPTRPEGSEQQSEAPVGEQCGSAGPVNGFWHPADWLACTDGKARPVEPGTFPLAHGVAARVGKLRAYGNAIVAPLAEQFIRAYAETCDA